MAKRDIVVLNETVPRLENPQPNDVAHVPAPLEVQGELKPISGVRFPDGTIATTARAIGSTDYIPLVDKGAANGVATLDANSKLVQMPTAADVGAAPASHTTDTNNPHQVTAAQAGAVPTSEKGVANGVATLDANGEVVQLPAGAAANPTLFLRGDGTWQNASGALSMPVKAVTAAYSVVKGDQGYLLDCSGTFTVTLLAPATAGDGFVQAIRNSGTGTITVTDGSYSRVLAGGESVLLTCNGTAYKDVVSDVGGQHIRCGLSADFYPSPINTWVNVSGWTTADDATQGTVTHDGTTFTFHADGKYRAVFKPAAYNNTLNVMSFLARLSFSTLGIQSSQYYTFVGTASAYGGLGVSEVIVNVTAGETMTAQAYVTVNANGGAYLLTTSELIIEKVG